MKKLLLVIFLISLSVAIAWSTKEYHEKTKNYITKGYAAGIDFPKLTFNYPLDWTVTENASLKESFDKIKISKGDYLIDIDQQLIAGMGGCQFKDSPLPKGPSIDLTNVDYQTIDSSYSKFRYVLNPLNKNDTKNAYLFCKELESSSGIYYMSEISIETPNVVNNRIFEEAIGIIKSLKVIPSD